MKYSSITQRISGEAVAAWDIHFAAVEAQARCEDVIVLSIGDPDFATDSAICAAVTRALAEGDTHYTDMSGRLPLREAIASGRLNMDASRIADGLLASARELLK